MERLEKVLINRTMALGDTILVTPFLRELKKQYHVTLSGWHTKHVSDVCDVVNFGPISSPDRLKKFDHYVNLDLAYEKEPTKHMLEAYRDVIAAHKLPVPDVTKVGPYVNSQPVKVIDEMYNNRPYAVIHVGGSGWAAKRIHTEFFHDLASNLTKYHGLSIVTIGSGNDRTIATKLNRRLSLVGSLNIAETRHVISKATIFVGVDSAPYHMASSTITPQVGLFTVVDGNLVKPLHKNSLVINSVASCMGCLKRLPPPVETHYCTSERPNHCTQEFDAFSVYQQILRHPSTSTALQQV